LTVPAVRRALPVLALLALLGVSAANAARPKAPAGEQQALTVLYGDDHSFAITPPVGWVIDDTSGLGSRIRVVLYPRGQTWFKAPVVMYENPMHKDPAHPSTFREMVDGNLARYRQHFPSALVKNAEPVQTLTGQGAELVYRAPEGSRPREAVAFFDQKGLVVMLVMNAHDPGGFARTLPAFREMVKSYQFLAAEIRTPTSAEDRPRGGHRK
jgi:hypothetical protein